MSDFFEEQIFEEMTPGERVRFVKLLREKNSRVGYERITDMFPDSGDLRRERYVKHCGFFDAGKDYRQRVFFAGNRVGKTEAGGTETSYHLTGEYPHWWTGKRFDRPVVAVVAGDTLTTLKDILQSKLLGGPFNTPKYGSGLVPKRLLHKPQNKQGSPGVYEEVFVTHVPTGGLSTLRFRSYDQGRRIFQGTEVDVFWADEEVPEDVYSEGVLRTMTTGGIVMLTFTPLNGLTSLCRHLLKVGDKNIVEQHYSDKVSLQDKTIKDKAGIHITMAGWDDAPHLSESAKLDLINTLPPHQKEARVKGIPSLGSGAIYPVVESDLYYDSFEIPDHYAKAYGMDVGWKNTAAIWGAKDPDSGIIYIYASYKKGEKPPAVHADAIRRNGAWIPGIIDFGAKESSQRDGKNLWNDYKKSYGLNIFMADKSVEAGIHKTLQLMLNGGIRILPSLVEFWDEFRLYQRKADGTVKKEHDHLMDCLRYLIMSFDKRAKQKMYAGSQWGQPDGWNSQSTTHDANGNPLTSIEIAMREADSDWQ